MDNSSIKSFLLNQMSITPKLIENELQNDKDFLNKRKLYYTLKQSIDNFITGNNDNRFYFMPGIRGVGKTTIILQLCDYLYQKVDSNQILYLNLDIVRSHVDFNLQDYLEVFIRDINYDNFMSDRPLFIFVDEAQYDSNWALDGKIIFDSYKNVFTIFTGSNALNISQMGDISRRALKEELFPLSFSEYLNLKYDCKFDSNLSSKFHDMIFTGEIENVSKLEQYIHTHTFLNLKGNPQKEWERYIQYSNLPFSLNKNEISVIKWSLAVKNIVVEKDMDIFSSFGSSLRSSANSLLNIIALQKPADLSLNKLADSLNISRNSVKNILDTLEKTKLLFHVEPYGSSMKRERKSWEYYFLPTQIKAAIYQSNGQASRNPQEYFSLLAENLIASSLFKMKQELLKDFGIFYDSSKGGVDFLINTIMGEVIPIEVGIGKKNKKQIKKAIERYDADYGIVISNKTQEITKEDNVINVPLLTFSLM